MVEKSKYVVKSIEKFSSDKIYTQYSNLNTMRRCHNQMIANDRTATDMFKLVTPKQTNVGLPGLLAVEHFRSTNNPSLSTIPSTTKFSHHQLCRSDTADLRASAIAMPTILHSLLVRCEHVR